MKMIVPPVLGSEHHPEDGKYRRSLAKEFREPTKSERRSTGMRLVAFGASRILRVRGMVPGNFGPAATRELQIEETGV